MLPYFDLMIMLACLSVRLLVVLPVCLPNLPASFINLLPTIIFSHCFHQTNIFQLLHLIYIFIILINHTNARLFTNNIYFRHNMHLEIYLAFADKSKLEMEEEE